MAGELKLTIVGAHTQSAITALAEIPDLTVTPAPQEPAPIQKTDDPVTIATAIIAVPSGIIKLWEECGKLAEKILAWSGQAQTQDPTFRATFDFPDGTRVTLDDVSAPDLAIILRRNLKEC